MPIPFCSQPSTNVIIVEKPGRISTAAKVISNTVSVKVHGKSIASGLKGDLPIPSLLAVKTPFLTGARHRFEMNLDWVWPISA